MSLSIINSFSNNTHRRPTILMILSHLNLQVVPAEQVVSRYGISTTPCIPSERFLKRFCLLPIKSS